MKFTSSWVSGQLLPEGAFGSLAALGYSSAGQACQCQQGRPCRYMAIGSFAELASSFGCVYSLPTLLIHLSLQFTSIHVHGNRYKRADQIAHNCIIKNKNKIHMK